MPDRPATLLIVANHYLGDTLWTLLAVREIKKKFPDSQITLLLRNDFKALFTGILSPEEIQIAPAILSDRRRETFNRLEFQKTVRHYRKKFEIIIDLGGNRYSALFSWLIRPRYLIGFSGDELGFLYDYRTPDRMHLPYPLRERPIRAIFTPLGLSDHSLLTETIAPKTLFSYEEICRKYQIDPTEKITVLAPCAGWPDKEWGDDNFSRLGALLQLKAGRKVYMIGSPAERQRLAKANLPIWNGENLAETIAFLSGAHSFVGNDSGLGQIAARFPSCHTILIFLTTSVYFCAPDGANVRTFPGRQTTPEQLLMEIDHANTLCPH